MLTLWFLRQDVIINVIAPPAPPPAPLQGKKNSFFKECYFGSQRNHKLSRLSPGCGYTFRVAAHNDIGTRYRSLLYGKLYQCQPQHMYFHMRSV